ncbi:MAG: o-succinylbenzoate synthase [Planctomycetota bacterium]|jgi:O-succinylbenzoate synthase
MKIDRIELHHVAMKLVKPFRTSFGNWDTIQSVLVRMTSGDLAGWGESSAGCIPDYCSEYSGGAFAVIRDFLAPRLLGRDVAGGAELQEALAGIRGNCFAKAALDLAWWDLHARQRGEPLWRTLGGAGPSVAVGADLGVKDSVEELLDEIAKVVEDGFERLKLKVRPGWDVDVIRAVRERFPGLVIHVDCNSAYRLADVEVFRALDGFDLAMIEQPLAHDDLIDHAELRRQIRTPICLDESIRSPAQADKAIRIGACDWINIKHGRVGGVTNAVRIHDVCRRAGVGNWIGGMLESAVGQAFACALAALGNVKYPSDIFPSSRFYSLDLGHPPVLLSGPSRITAAAGPGIGVEPDPKRLEELTLQRAALP